MTMKPYIKLVISAFFYYSKLFYLIRLWNNIVGKRLIILTFHRVTDNSGEEQDSLLPTINISLNNFDSLMRFIKKHYKIISINDYFQSAKIGVRLPYNCLLLTFDDGYKETLENVLPVLRKHELHAILFVPTAIIDKGGFFWWDEIYYFLTNTKDCDIVDTHTSDATIEHFLDWIKQILSKTPKDRRTAIIDFIEALQNSKVEIRNRVLQYLFDNHVHVNKDRVQNRVVLGWDQIKYLNSCGFEIGSHTVNHEFLPTVSDKEVVDELTNSKKRLEGQLECKIFCFSYPGGKYIDKTAKLVEEAGYSCAFTTDEGVNSLDVGRYKLKRINISDEEVSNFKGKFSKAITAWSLFLKW